MYLYIRNIYGQQTMRKLPLRQIAKIYLYVYFVAPKEQRPVMKIFFIKPLDTRPTK